MAKISVNEAPVEALFGPDAMRAILFAFRDLKHGETWVVRLCAPLDQPDAIALLVIMGETKAMLHINEAVYMADTLERGVSLFPGSDLAEQVPQLINALRRCVHESKDLSGTVH